MNKFKSTTKLFWLALTVGSGFIFSSVLGLTPSYSAPQKDITTFDCIRQGNYYATVARRGNRTTSPMITWKDTSIKDWPPQKRCSVVSGKLTKAVSSQGGRLRTLRLTHGTVNSQPVICYITHVQGECNDQNLLLTLKPSERGREAEILQQLMSFSVKGTGEPLSRSVEGRTIVNLGLAAEQMLNQPGNKIQPSTTPVTPSGPSQSINSPVEEDNSI
ncbi:COP23 domain-containing protein [Pelatocladus sp. BLCC-F211]|uniref:COP23 domain-containing protein n=1 Tax=Pelatocladus sp. BLCC-F211 TaxID=3342752 RepID=UPI0035B98E6E